MPDDWYLLDDTIYNDKDPFFQMCLETFAKEYGNETFGDFDTPYVLEEWVDEGIWLSREEAEDYAKSHEYNYRDGWMVYGLPANGKLAELIKNT